MPFTHLLGPQRLVFSLQCKAPATSWGPTHLPQPPTVPTTTPLSSRAPLPRSTSCVFANYSLSAQPVERAVKTPGILLAVSVMTWAPVSLVSVAQPSQHYTAVPLDTLQV